MKTKFIASKNNVVMLAIAATFFSTANAEEAKVLNIYNWSDYIAEDTIANFEAETGIDVVYDVFDSNEVLQTKLLTGGTGYDVVVPTGSFLERQIKAGVFGKLDKSLLTNYGNLDESVLKAAAGHDPGNEHAVNYMWGTNGFGYNEAKIKEIMPDAPVDSWAMVFDVNVVSKFASCGVTLLDSPAEIYPLALAYLGLDPKGENKEDLVKVEELLNSIRPYIKYFHSSQYINDLANGDICIAVGYSGDVLQARDRASEADQGVVVSYVAPKEGTMIWFDMLAIPADAPHPMNAHLFIDYLMRPEVIAAVTNYVNYANGNKASLEFVDESVKNDPSVYPSDEVREKLFTQVVYSQRFNRSLTRAWTSVKTGG